MRPTISSRREATKEEEEHIVPSRINLFTGSDLAMESISIIHFETIILTRN